MKLIQTVTLTGTQANITFSSIPQSYTDLFIIASARDNSNPNTNAPLNFGTNGRHLGGNGGSAFSGTTTTGGIYNGVVNGGQSTANSFGASTCYLSNYKSTGTKVFLSEGGQAQNGAAAELMLGLTKDTSAAAITTLVITAFGTGFVSGTTISLYGILAGSDGIVTVS